jgi:hypothetical protein
VCACGYVGSWSPSSPTNEELVQAIFMYTTSWRTGCARTWTWLQDCLHSHILQQSISMCLWRRTYQVEWITKGRRRSRDECRGGDRDDTDIFLGRTNNHISKKQTHSPYRVDPYLRSTLPLMVAVIHATTISLWGVEDTTILPWRKRTVLCSVFDTEWGVTHSTGTQAVHDVQSKSIVLALRDAVWR